MSKILYASLIIAMLATSPAGAAPTPAGAAPSPGGAMAPAAHAAGTLPTVRHLVYQFGYNQKAAASGNNTGTTTIDIVGLASDGGLTVKATDNWWMAVHPKQSNTCEVYANGSVTCAKAPYSLTAIQLNIVPLLGQNYFAALSGSPTASWNATYSVKATFAPGASGLGFAGQVYTWNGAYALTGKGVSPQQPPLILIHSNGSLTQQGGRFLKLNTKANFLYDPRIKMPVYVDSLTTVVPQMSTSSYAVQLTLIRT